MLVCVCVCVRVHCLYMLLCLSAICKGARKTQNIKIFYLLLFFIFDIIKLFKLRVKLCLLAQLNRNFLKVKIVY